MNWVVMTWDLHENIQAAEAAQTGSDRIARQARTPL